MPCYYTGTAEGDARLAASEANSKVTELTQHLCAVLTNLETEIGYESNEWFKIVSDSVHGWWRKHKAIDAAKG